MLCKLALVSVCLVALLSGPVRASSCKEAAENYVRDFGTGYKLLEVSSCHSPDGAIYDQVMSLIMRSPDEKYVSCLDIKVRSGRVVDKGTCY